jgi:hypothetical protein
MGHGILSILLKRSKVKYVKRQRLLKGDIDLIHCVWRYIERLIHEYKLKFRYLFLLIKDLKGICAWLDVLTVEKFAIPEVIRHSCLSFDGLVVDENFIRVLIARHLNLNLRFKIPFWNKLKWAQLSHKADSLFA